MLFRSVVGWWGGEVVEGNGAASSEPPHHPTTSPPRHPTTPLLLWSPGDAHAQVAACNGCGQCRSGPPQRMCPIFQATHEEAAAPRAKANLLRHLMQDKTDPRQLAPDEVRAVADLCVNCKMCATECPAHVNVPKLMLEAKAANVAEHGLNWKDWFLARTDGFARLAGAFALLGALAVLCIVVLSVTAAVS